MAPSAAAVIARAGERARREPDFAGVLAALIDAPTAAAGTYTREAARALNRQRFDNVVEEFKADALITSEVQRLLKLGTPQAVHQLRKRKKLLGFTSGNGTWFPAWQFEPGRLRLDLARILEQLARFTSDPIAADRVMRLVRDDVDGRSLNEALKDPPSARTAWAILGSLGS
ncbi:MAG: hypothetical protein M3083_06310 [Actinomycetota bacterium]|nr:hypothetical protein [Actinomycetota bacterium]